MEKENKKARDDARKEYNEMVRDLARFIRKRDPRYKSHLASQKATAAAKAFARGSSSATPTHQPPSTPLPEYVEQEWQKAAPSNQDADLEWAAAENGGDEEEWECVACGKTFRSEAAWDSHERSKKHMQAVERLRRAMMDENEELGLDAEGEQEDERAIDDDESVEEPPESPLEEGFITPPEDSAVETDAPLKEEEAQAVEEVETEDAHQRSRRKKKGKKKSRAPSPDIAPPPPKTERRARGRHRSETPEPADSVDTPAEPIPTDMDQDVASPNTATSSAAPTPEEQDGAADSAHEQPHPEMSKRDKRRAREAAKKAKELEAEHTPQVC